MNNHAHILKPRRGHLDFLANLMESLNYLPWISGAAQPKLTQDRLLGIAIAVPSPAEQEKIITWVTDETAPLKVAITQAKREIDLLREYGTRLIADVVTGKLDVREPAALLREEAEKPEPIDEEEAPGEDDEVGRWPRCRGCLRGSRGVTVVSRMPAGRASLLGLMNRYLPALMDTSVLLLEVHKLVCFLRAAGEPLCLRCVKAPFGPGVSEIPSWLAATGG